MVDLNSRKIGDILIFGIWILIIININIVFSRFILRIDLTEEKRYTISEATIDLLESLEDVVYIDVYLEGKFPPGFQRLQKAIQQTLEDFRVYAGDNIQYRFINPDEIESNKGQETLIKSLGEKGIQPTNLTAKEDGKRTEKLIFPGAIISYAGIDMGVMLLKGNKSASPQERLNQSIEGVEFEFATVIDRLVNIDRKRIGLIKGHGELDSMKIISIKNSLLESYDIFDVNLPSKNNLDGYDVIIIAKPVKPFSEKDLYKVDQFIMKGGKAIFFTDFLSVNLDSIGREGTIGYPIETNLENLLFRYGIRINKDFLLDLSSGGFPVVVGNMGSEPQIQLMPWPFYPIINQYSNHPIVRNLDAVYLRFTSSIDTVKADGIVKTPLMFSSPYSKTAGSPVRVSLNDLRKEMSPEIFNQGSQPIAYLLEGPFTSAFKNRILPEGIPNESFKDTGIETGILVCADGDFVRNEINMQSGMPSDLGYEPFMKAEFANKDFILNSLSYLLDDDGLILSRNKEITIRPLDRIKIENEKLGWQVLNLILPIIIIGIYGLIRQYYRKRKYSS